jgi:hypothetical protein
MVAKILGIAGPSGCGKDEVADFAANFGYQKMKIADDIRDEFAAFLKLGLEYAAFEDGCLPLHFDTVIDAYVKAIYDKPTSPESRVALQWWGTDYRRAEDPNYWTKNLKSKLQEGQTVISDVRILLERDLIHSVGGEIWWINRTDLAPVGILGHATENSLTAADCDRIIDNNSTLVEFLGKIDFIFRNC